jgi:hypothetical protein
LDDGHLEGGGGSAGAKGDYRIMTGHLFSCLLLPFSGRGRFLGIRDRGCGEGLGE